VEAEFTVGDDSTRPDLASGGWPEGVDGSRSGVLEAARDVVGLCRLPKKVRIVAPRRVSARTLGALLALPIALLLVFTVLPAYAGAATTASRSASAPAMRASHRLHLDSNLTADFGRSGTVSIGVSKSSSEDWDLRPTSFGRGTQTPLSLTSSSTQLTSQLYNHGAMSVWYKDDTSKIEQDFRIEQKPAGSSGQVSVTMLSSGGLTPQLTSPTSISLRGPSGWSAISYSGLKVTDALGRILPAHLAVSDGEIHIAFDDTGAQYPVTVDPWIQQTTLDPPATASSFGTTLASSNTGTTVIVGDPDGSLTGTGNATIYTFDGTTWSSGTPLTQPSGAQEFGAAVAISGDGKTALVGDPLGGLDYDGSATIFTLSGSTWSSGTGLAQPSDAYAFGTSVALSAAGTTALVGDPGGGATSKGSATYFTGGPSAWTGGTALVPPNAAGVNSEFGTTVALAADGNMALVGDPMGLTTHKGAVYSYSGASFTTMHSLAAAAKSVAFGTSIAISDVPTNPVAIVGDPTGGAAGTGAVTIETLTSGTTWSVTTSLAPPTPAGQFGTAVAISTGGTSAVVGDPTGGSDQTGTAATYSSTTGTWSAAAPLAAPIGSVSFGSSSTISGDGSTVLIGDPTGGDGEGAVTVYTSNGTGWSLGAGADPPASAFSFGSAVATSANGSVIVEGDPDGFNGTSTNGAATVLTYNGSTLTTGPSLTAPAGEQAFGTSTAVSANGLVAVVGDPDASPSGTATVYTKNGSSWSSGTQLTQPETATDFGNSVSISANGTEILVGDPEGGENSTGDATVYRLNNGTWSSGTSIGPPAITNSFGTTVALSGDGSTALVSDLPLSASGVGTVSSYTYFNGVWALDSSLPLPSYASYQFGFSLALSATGGVALVGDPTGGSTGKGAATLMTRNGAIWSVSTSFSPLETAASFGSAVALSAGGTVALVGDPTASLYGDATVYTFAASSWSPFGLTVTANATNFGTSVALSSDGNTAVVGDSSGGEDGDGAVTAFSLNSTKTPTVVTPTTSPVSATSGSSVTYTATVAPQSGAGTPSGSVTFYLGPLMLCTATLSSRSGQCTANTAPLGNGTVVASYSGDSTFAASSATTTISVKAGTTTAPTVAPTSTNFGSTVEYSVRVSSTSGTPTGTVAFSVGGTNLCTTALVSGSGKCPAASAPGGSDSVTATYDGDQNFKASTGSTPLTVSKLATTTVASANPSTAIHGNQISFHATVSASHGTPTGSVTFTLGGTTLCATGALSGGSASCSSASAPVGTSKVTATYSGSSNYVASSGTTTVTVNSGPANSTGYDLVGSDGGVFVFPVGQSSGFFGSLPGLGVKVDNVVGIVPTNHYNGYDLVGNDGGVFVFPVGQTSGFFGSLPGLGVTVSNIVGIVPTADDGGYFLVGSDGGVFAFGNSPFEGSLPSIGIQVNNIVGIAPTADDKGYWVVGSNGSVYAFGDATAYGSVTNLGAGIRIVGIAASGDSKGYWLVGNDGSVYAFGDAVNYGSLPAAGVAVNSIVSIVPTPTGKGYWLIGDDGGIYAFGDATPEGSLPALNVNVNNIVGAVPTA
jgi:Bacterial Ig-like domain (group 3)